MVAFVAGSGMAAPLVRLASAPTAQRSDGLFLLGLAIWMGVGLALGWHMVHLQMDYFIRCRQLEHLNIPVTPEEMSEIYLNDPLGWFTQSPSQMRVLWRLLWARQADPSLEAERRRVVRWNWITLAWVMFGGAIPIALSMVGN